ncbi:MAG: sigma-70 family RNA polymerase sigma factor [Planctomycetota bacterium]
MTAPDPCDIQALLENGNWVRRLARKLLYDPESVEDVVQDVWIAALSRPPGRPEVLRAWLRTVVRNLSFLANRDRRRRARREQQSPRPVASMRPDELAHRLETQAALVNAILRLGEPYRSVIYMRYYEDLQPAEIAERRGVPASTVRTQLARGLERLREQLEQRYGDRAAWRAALLPLALPALHPGLPGGADVPSKPGTRMTLARAALAVTTAVALLGLSAVVRNPESRVVPAGEPSAIADTPIALAPEPRTLAPDTPSPRSDMGVAPTSPRTAPAPRRPDEAQAGSWVATADTDSALAASYPLCVTDLETGRPVANASVVLHDLGSPDATPVGSTDRDGFLWVPRASLCRQSFAVFADGYIEHREPARLRSLAAEGTLHVGLRPVFEAKVRVRLPNGEPARRATVVVRAVTHSKPAAPAESRTTDGRGEIVYLARHYHATLEIDLPGYARVSVPAELPETTITLALGSDVRARVMDDTGAPVADCGIEISSERWVRSPQWTRSDPSGCFSLGALAPDDLVTVKFFHSALPAYQLQGLPPDPREVWAFEIPRGVSLRGCVVAPAGGPPVTGGLVFLARAEGTEEVRVGEISALSRARARPNSRSRTRLMPLQRSPISESGQFEVGPVTSANERYLFIHHPHYVNQIHLVGSSNASPRLFTLDPGARAGGRVFDPLGTPMEGVVLHLGELWSNGMESVLGRTRTDADGRFEFVGVPAVIDQELTGDRDEAGRPVRRTAVFLCAFAPDQLLALHGLPVRETSIPGAFPITPGDMDLQLVASHRDLALTLDVDLVDRGGRLIRTWTPTLIVEAGGKVWRGTIGQNLDTYLLYTDHQVQVSDLEGARVLFMPLGHRWQRVTLDRSWLEPRSTEPSVAIELAPRPGSSTPITVTRTDGAPWVDVPLAIAMENGSATAATPTTWVEVGRTDGRGSVDLSFLPTGHHVVYTRSAEGEVQTDPTEREWRPLGTVYCSPQGTTEWAQGQ